MLKFAYTYREAINMLTGDQTLQLHEYELSDDDWSLVKQLQDSLKVSIYLSFHIVLYWFIVSDLQNCDSEILNRHSLPCHRYPCDGQDAWQAYKGCWEQAVLITSTGREAPQQVLLPHWQLWNLLYCYK